MRIKFLPLALIFAASTLVSCDEDNPLGTSSELETQLGEFYLEAESLGNSIYNNIDLARRDSIFNADDSAVVNGAVVKRTGTAFTIDFGNGVAGSDGKTRKGMITVAETGSYLTAGGQLSAALSNFKVDDVSIQGAFAIINNGNGSIDVAITGFKIGNEFSLNSNKNVIWKSGFATPTNAGDDRYDLSGSAIGTELAGNNMVTTTINETLVFDRLCQYGVTKGKVSLALTGDSISETTTGSIDFIDTDGCNNVARISIVKGTTSASVTRTFDGF